MPQSIPRGLTREHVLRALADLDAGIDHSFGAPTGYELIRDGKRYAPKAVVGLACRYLLGRVLRHDEFSGGEAPGQANFVLRQLGFTVVKKGEAVEEGQDSQAGKDWSAREVRLVVADYFRMLELEFLGKPCDEAEHRNALLPQLDGREGTAIDSKHANISAVLTGLGLPYVEGYQPCGNDQALLEEEVQGFLDQHHSFLEQLAAAPVVNPDKPAATDGLDLGKIIEEAPDVLPAPKEPGKPWKSRKGRRIDFALRDALNRQLGKLGEEFVVRLERHRLLSKGRDDLAAQVQWVAETLGDGLGFDVLSFDHTDDSERLIEVKTTGLGKHFPFYVTSTELRCSEDVGEQFQLFRVFDFARRARAYVLTGPLRDHCLLEPTQYRATLKGAS